MHIASETDIQGALGRVPAAAYRMKVIDDNALINVTRTTCRFDGDPAQLIYCGHG